MNPQRAKAIPINDPTFAMSDAAAREFVLVAKATDEKAQQVFRARAFSLLQYPEVERDDYLGMLCSKLGYGALDVDRQAFLTAECQDALAPGLCRACYYLYPSVPAMATSKTCTQCGFPTVTGGLALASDAEYSLPYFLKDVML